MITNYDPNVYWATHQVELTYMMWDYVLTEVVQLGGNTKGGSVIKSAIELHADRLYEEQGAVPTLILKRGAGVDDADTLECPCNEFLRERDSEPDIELWLSQMCVGIRIVGHTQKARK